MPDASARSKKLHREEVAMAVTISRQDILHFGCGTAAMLGVSPVLCGGVNPDYSAPYPDGQE
jgi:hypothetical protein